MSAQRPNLFRYGRKELSQDAMICWLLDWANECHAKSNNEADRHLHECGQKFARALFAKHDRAAPDEIRKVELGQQVSGIDVLAWINGEYALLIEDKTDSGAHDGQLKKYHKHVLDGGCKICGEKIEPSPEKSFPIFFKTGNMPLRDKKHIETKIDLDPPYPPYRVFERRDFLESMKIYDRSVSEILTDFIAHMKELEEEADSWKCIPAKEKWPSRAWQGLYRKLEETMQFKEHGWNYVSNRAGGFMGFWWYFKPELDALVYLQTEQEKLCFKIKVSEEPKRPKLRHRWHERIMKANESLGMGISKPKFGNGEHMTVAVLNGDWRQIGDDGRLDFKATVRVLKNAERVVDEAMNS